MNSVNVNLHCYCNIGMAAGRIRAGFFHTRTRLASLPWKPRPSPFIKRIFFSTPNPSGPRGPRPLMPSQAQNQKCKFWFMIFRTKITNTDKSKHDHKHKHRNHKHKCQIYDFPFQNHKPNTNFRSMIFDFKITNTNTNSHDWEFETNWTQKKKMENKEEWDQGRWGWNGAVLVLDCLWACGCVSERAESWRRRSDRVRQWVRELRQLGTTVRVRAAVRGKAVGPAMRLGVSEIVS